VSPGRRTHITLVSPGRCTYVTVVPHGRRIRVTVVSRGRRTRVTLVSPGRRTRVTVVSRGRRTRVTLVSRGRCTHVTVVPHGRRIRVTVVSRGRHVGGKVVSRGRHSFAVWMQIFRLDAQQGVVVVMGDVRRRFVSDVTIRISCIPTPTEWWTLSFHHRPLSVFTQTALTLSWPSMKPLHTDGVWFLLNSI
jgi:hypothetical protein